MDSHEGVVKTNPPEPPHEAILRTRWLGAKIEFCIAGTARTAMLISKIYYRIFILVPFVTYRLSFRSPTPVPQLVLNRHDLEIAYEQV